MKYNRDEMTDKWQLPGQTVGSKGTEVSASSLGVQIFSNLYCLGSIRPVQE